MEILLVVNDCLSEGQEAEFHWRCKGDEVEEQLLVLLDQKLLPTPKTSLVTVYEILLVGAYKLAEFPLATDRTGHVHLDPAADLDFVKFCRGLQSKVNQLTRERIE